jgi:hypothetical protein
MIVIWLIAMSFSAIKALSADTVVYTIDHTGADITLTFVVKPPHTIVENTLSPIGVETLRKIWL